MAMLQKLTIEEFINAKKGLTETSWQWKQRAAKKLKRIVKKEGWLYLMELSRHYEQQELSQLIKRVIKVQGKDVFLTVLKLKLVGGTWNTLLKREEIEALISCLNTTVTLSYDWLTSYECFCAWQTALINRRYLRELEAAQKQQEQEKNVVDTNIELPDFLKGGITGG